MVEMNCNESVPKDDTYKACKNKCDTFKQILIILKDSQKLQASEPPLVIIIHILQEYSMKAKG